MHECEFQASTFKTLAFTRQCLHVCMSVFGLQGQNVFTLNRR